jgi:uncharacterized protein
VNVLVSGSSGLIGAALCRHLGNEGDSVVRLGRPSPTSPPGPGVSWEPVGGLLDRDALQRQGPYDAAVHLAGAPIGEGRWTPQRRREIVESRVRGAELLVTALAELEVRPAVLVSASAVGYYGNAGEVELTEESPNGHDFLAELCRRWEAAAAEAAPAGSRVVVVRNGVVLSARGGALARQLPLFRLGLGGRLGRGRQWLSWITLDDEVAVLARALRDTSLVGALNATSPEPVTNATFTAALGRALRRPALLAVPRPALAAVFGREFVDQVALASQRAIPARLTRAGHDFMHPEIDGALASVLARHG